MWRWKLRDRIDGRPPIQNILMGFAELISQRSTDPKIKVGAVITDESMEKIIGMGYNGGPKGLYNDRQSLETGHSGFLHAEINALIKCDYSINNKKMFVTLSPCYSCSIALINAGVVAVYFNKVYKDDTRGLDLLKQAGIKVCMIKI